MQKWVKFHWIRWSITISCRIFAQIQNVSQIVPFSTLLRRLNKLRKIDSDDLSKLSVICCFWEIFGICSGYTVKMAQVNLMGKASNFTCQRHVCWHFKDFEQVSIFIEFFPCKQCAFLTFRFSFRYHCLLFVSLWALQNMWEVVGLHQKHFATFCSRFWKMLLEKYFKLSTRLQWQKPSPPWKLKVLIWEALIVLSLFKWTHYTKRKLNNTLNFH